MREYLAYSLAQVKPLLLLEDWKALIPSQHESLPFAYGSASSRNNSARRSEPLRSKKRRTWSGSARLVEHGRQSGSQEAGPGCRKIHRSIVEQAAPPRKIRPRMPELVKEVVEADYGAARRDRLAKLGGFQVYDYNV